MSKVVEGVAEIAGAVALGFLTFGLADVGLAFSMLTYLTWSAEILGVVGISTTLAGIAQALEGGPSTPYSFKGAAIARQCVYGQFRVAGAIVYISTSNGGANLHQVVVWASHPIQGGGSLYIDGRELHTDGSGHGDTNTYTDDNGNQYHFGPVDAYVEHGTGSPSGTWFASLNAEDPNWDSSCTLNGMAATYFRAGYDTNVYSGIPTLKRTIYGKNNIYDPRSGTYGYTNNAALVIADFLCDTTWGLGCIYSAEIDEDQLIAAANLCDEQVPLAAGGAESRYTINGYFDTNSSPGDVLDALLQACEGRISYTGGRWKIYPAAWYGTSLTFDENAIIGPVKWSPRRKYRDLCNAVRASYISPVYPYAQVGYDQDHKNEGVWSGEWQPTDMPEYAQDVLHGYSIDANLTQDGGVKLYMQRNYRFVTSCATAQRLAKIYLLRNRQQGSGTLPMNLSAYQAIAQDVIQVSFATALGWDAKYLEIETLRFVLKTDKDGNEPPQLYCELDVCETDLSVYLWSPAEELTVEDFQSPAFTDNYQVGAPSGLALESGADSAVIGVDGIIVPRIHVTWTPPTDPFTLSGGYVELQWQHAGDATWISEGRFEATTTRYYITGVVAGQGYYVQIRSVRGNGATSEWISAGPHIVSTTVSNVSYSNGFNSLLNPGFESALGLGIADGWTITQNDPAFFIQRENASSPYVHSGSWCLLLRLLPGSVLPANSSSGARVQSLAIPCVGGQNVYFGGWLRWDVNTSDPAPSGVVLQQRIGLMFYDSNMNFISESIPLGDIESWNDMYQNESGMAAAPSNAAYFQLELAAFANNNNSFAVTLNATDLLLDARYDDVFGMPQSATSAILTPQGSIQPSQAISVPYSVTETSVTFSWSAQSILRSDGTSLAVPSGSTTINGLSPGTTYYTYWYAAVSSGALAMTNGSPPPTSPNAVDAALTGQDGRVPVGPIPFTTTNTSGGTGGGTGGGGDTCPEAAELVDVRGRGHAPAGEVKAGDWIRGRNFRSGSDVYRRVVQVQPESCVAWRVIRGYRISPCEQIYVDGKWTMPYQVNSVVDTFLGRKIKITVEADADNEHNYYLVGGEQELLIHNFLIYPC